MASFANWNPYKNYVQSGGPGPGMVDGRFVTGAYTGLFAGPPRLANLGATVNLANALDTSPETASHIVYPIGLTQSVNVSHNRQFNRIFELGSERSYFISGRTMGQLALARVLYHGPSILRVLYAYYQDSTANVPALFTNVGMTTMANPHDVVIPPGFQNFYINLASDLFSQPIGILMIVQDVNQMAYGACYFESCVIPNHTWATDAQGVIVQESVALQFETAVPIHMTAVDLIT